MLPIQPSPAQPNFQCVSMQLVLAYFSSFHRYFDSYVFDILGYIHFPQEGKNIVWHYVSNLSNKKRLLGSWYK
jgi:hypothetical protein